MRLRLFGKVLTGVARVFSIASLTAFTTTATINQPSYAEGTTFYCGTSKYEGKTVPVTFARTQDGKNVPMIRWLESDYFPPQWTPQRRCQEVTRRFQRSYDNGTLKYITSGTLKGEPAICAVALANAPCTESTLLFTVRRGTNASATLRSLLDRRGLAAGRVDNQRGGNSFNINVDAYLKNAEVEPNSDSTSQSGAGASNTP